MSFLPVRSCHHRRSWRSAVADATYVSLKGVIAADACPAVTVGEGRLRVPQGADHYSFTSSNRKSSTQAVPLFEQWNVRSGNGHHFSETNSTITCFQPSPALTRVVEITPSLWGACCSRPFGEGQPGLHGGNRHRLVLEVLQLTDRDDDAAAVLELDFGLLAQVLGQFGRQPAQAGLVSVEDESSRRISDRAFGNSVAGSAIPASIEPRPS